jgi:hypothetical protein
VSKVDDLIAYATTEIGKPYVYGDEGPDTFDCSGLMQWVYSHVGVQLPRTARDQQAATAKVSNPSPGDLVFFGSPATHVGLYIGAGRMISAPHPGASVHITNVGTPTNYGRVTSLGVGSTVSAVGDTVTTGLGDIGGDALAAAWQKIAPDVRGFALTGIFALLGVGLVTAGLWRAAGGSEARERVKTMIVPEGDQQ